MELKWHHLFSCRAADFTENQSQQSHQSTANQIIPQETNIR